MADEDGLRSRILRSHHMLREGTRLAGTSMATIVAANGININFSPQAIRYRINLAGQDYFQLTETIPTLHHFIPASRAQSGQQQVDTFYISRRLDDPQGQFLGLVLIGISVEFHGFYEQVARNLEPWRPDQPLSRRPHAAYPVAP